MTDAPLLTLSHRQRLEHLSGSWELRVRAKAFGTEPQVLRENIAALKAAIGTADMARQYYDAWKKERDRSEKASLILDEIRATLDDFARRGGPRPKRVDMAALSNRVQAAFEALEY